MEPNIGLIGTGTMGRAIASGLLRSKIARPEQLSGCMRSKEAAAEAAAELGISVDTKTEACARASQVLVVCLKPNRILAVLEELREAGALDHDPLVISIAAGVDLAALEQAAGEQRRVIRAMPNTPARIGEGMTVISGGARASSEDEELAKSLFQPLGRVLTLDEEHMNTVTGLSGSGPAFVYVILEALAEGAVMMGLPRKVALELACQTVQGAARMVLETGRHPAELKDEVTTPAGCTISALLSLEDGRLRSVLARGVQEAARSASGLG